MGDPGLTDLRRPFVAGADRFQRSFRFGLGLAGMFLSTVVLTLAVLASVAPLAPRWQSTVVASGSMEPALRRGDVVIFHHPSIDDVGKGSVIVFEANGLSIVHRVVDVNPDGTLVTQGDANHVRDSGEVTADEFHGAGEVVVPWIGLPRLWWMEGRHLLVLATVAAVLIALRSSRLTSDPANDPWSGAERPSPATVWLGSPVPAPMSTPSLLTGLSASASASASAFASEAVLA